MIKKSPPRSSPPSRPTPFKIRPSDKPIATGGFGRLARLHHLALLEASKELLQHQYYGSAIVIAQTACEVFTEVAIATILKNRGLESLDQPISSLVRSFNLTNDKLRKLYIALSGDAVHQVSFWSKYVAMVDLRNKVVHRGKQVTPKEAKDAVEIAAKMIIHLEKALEAKYPRHGWIWKEP